jgi:glycosyltransferase involved in cell wall biosynthesis
MIIFANRYFHPDQSATSRMVSSLAFALAREGQPVTVLASRQYHDRSGGRLLADEMVDGVRIHRLATSGFGRRRLLGRALDYLGYHLLAALWLLAHARRGDICIVCTDPPLLSVSVALPLRLRGAKLVNWLMDLFPEVAIDLGLVRRKGIAAGLSLRVRDWSLRRAAANACPMDAMARYLAERGIAAEKLTVTPHWSDGDEIYPVARAGNQLRRAWHYGPEFVVGYSGNFGRAHDFSTILEAAERLRDRDDIAFLFIGDGQQRSLVEAEAARRGLKRITFKPLQPGELLAESLSVADLHLISLQPILDRSIVPSKLYGVLAAGRPGLFIGAADSEVARVLDAGDCGLSVRIGEGEVLAHTIADLAAAPEVVARMSANARGTYEAHYTRERGVATWRALLAAVAATPQAKRAALRGARAHG